MPDKQSDTKNAAVDVRPHVYIDGDIVPAEKACISVFDSGFGFGDGVWEGIRVYDGKIFELDAHIRRLLDSAHAIAIEPRMTAADLRNEVLRWLACAGIDSSAHFRIILTRGHRWPPRLDATNSEQGPTWVFMAGVIDNSHYQERGKAAIIASTRRQSPDSIDPKIKSLNYLGSILARMQARACGVDEALMLDPRGYLAEGAGSNIFIVKLQEIHTPHADSCLPGITRATVISLARAANYNVIERNISPSEVLMADELFECGTAAGITPITRVNGVPIGTGEVGKVVRDLQRRYATYIANTSEEIPNAVRAQ